MRSIFTLITILSTLIVTAQKIKVKKGDIFIDDTKIGFLEKEGSAFKARTFIIKSLDETPIIKATQRFAHSLLEKEDKMFPYTLLEFPTKGIRVGMDNDKIVFFEETFVKFFVQNEILTNGSLNDAAISKLTEANSDTLPQKIVAYLTKEEEYMGKMDIIKERDITKPVSFLIKGNSEEKEFNINYSCSNYDIYQDKVLIGSVKVKVPYFVDVKNELSVSVNPGASITSPAVYVFYNSEQVPIASLPLESMSNFRVYNGDMKISYNKHGYHNYTDRAKKFQEITKWLVSNNKL